MMLGAQARAAEYNAAKNASARQANREADEQKLPPKPAPISLSAYTRNPQINRNKGAKNWVPLVLPEVNEGGEAQDNESSDSIMSSKDQSAILDPSNYTPSAPTSSHQGQIRVNMPKSVAPAAPRAMRAPGQPALAVQQFTPMPNPQRVPNDTANFMPTALYAGTPGNQTVGMYTYPQYGWMSGLPMLDHAGFTMNATPEGMHRFGGMMVPTDITPTKQEQKLSLLSQAYRNPLFAIPDNNFPEYDEGAVHMQHQYANSSVPIPNQGTDYMFRVIQPAIAGNHCPPRHQPAHSDFESEPKTAIFNPQPGLSRHNSLPLAAASPITPPRQLDSHALMSMTQPIIRDKENNIPYDRASKMQKFIAAQQAVAKTGKTVLNNPDLRKSHETPAEKSNDQVQKPTPVKSEDSTEADNQILLDQAKSSAPRVPPGLEEVKPKLEFDYSFPPAPLVSQDDFMHDLFGVGTEEWLDLRPVSRKDRRTMLDIMTFVHLDLEARNALCGDSSKDPIRKQAIEAWMHTDPRPNQAARNEADEIAKHYSSTTNEPAPDVGHHPNTQEVDIDAGIVRGAGNVMATLTEYIAENGTKTEDSAQDYFNRTKAVPEFAIERNGLGTNRHSLFENEGGIFYNPPHRIARDPRFRAHGKERSKTKSEDGWPLHYDAYSRRKV